MKGFWVRRWVGVLKAEEDKMKLVLLGAPGSGKGTQGERIAKKYNIPQVSTGDLLRAAIRDNTPLGIKAKEYMDQGKLVPDQLILDVMSVRMNDADCKNGYILDGFPRTIAQADGLDKLLAGKKVKLDAVVNIVVSDDEVVKRLGGRRQCKKCSAVYHVRFSPPKKNANLCDKCGGELYQRDDDKEATIKNRLKVYKEQTAPLISYYKNLVKDVNGIGNADEIFSNVSSLIDNLAAAK